MPLMHSFANERERERDEGELPFSYIKFEKLEKRVYINYFLHLIWMAHIQVFLFAFIIHMY